jgi:hypothetical protein
MQATHTDVLPASVNAVQNKARASHADSRLWYVSWQSGFGWPSFYGIKVRYVYRWLVKLQEVQNQWSVLDLSETFLREHS